MAPRYTYRGRKSYATKSNVQRTHKTPGGTLAVLTATKKARRSRCPVTGQLLQGVKVARPMAFSRLARRERRVNRAYGGSLSGGAVKDRILRAFLIEEAKIVKRVLKLQAAKAAAADKTAAASKGGKKGKK